MEFTKMHGTGNDYIYLNCMDAMPEDPEALSRRLSHRHFGVGGDGLICVCPSTKGDFQMRMFNADGSEGAMCGNGLRCLGKYVYDKGLTRRTLLRVETLSGVRTVRLRLRGGQVWGATVDMGPPRVGAPLRVELADGPVTGVPVSMGNPPFVLQAEDLDGLELRRLGSELEGLARFPGGVNVEFVRVRRPDLLEMRVWERGSGETMACGSGACAASAAMMAAGRLARQAQVRLPGGELSIQWSLSDGHMYMTGPTVTVYDGQIAD